MKRYKVKIERYQDGVKLDWETTKVIEESTQPEVGYGVFLLTNPPIHQFYSSVEEVPIDTPLT